MGGFRSESPRRLERIVRGRCASRQQLPILAHASEAMLRRWDSASQPTTQPVCSQIPLLSSQNNLLVQIIHSPTLPSTSALPFRRIATLARRIVGSNRAAKRLCSVLGITHSTSPEQEITRDDRRLQRQLLGAFYGLCRERQLHRCYHPYITSGLDVPVDESDFVQSFSVASTRCLYGSLLLT